MNISADKYKELLHVAECLSYGLDSAEIRTAVGDSLIRLLDADFYASYVWSGKDRKFSDGVSINMDKKNLSQYDDYYQFHDPITHQLQRRQRATLVNEIMPQDELIQTEFYNDFLSTDGLYWGINLYAFDGRDNIGDIRIWRKKSASNFDDTSLQLLHMIHPHFTNSLRSIKRLDEALEPDVEKVGPTVTASWDADLIEKEFGFTQREAQIVREILRGKKDDEIADALCIAFSTLRTHINHIFDKANVRNRSSLCHKVLNKITGFC